MSNEDFKSLESRVKVGHTPVIVSDGIRWVEHERVEAERHDLTTAIEKWRRDWESRDPERYLAHYSKDFRAGSMSRAAFADHKRRVNAGKRFIDVEIDEMGAFRYPGESELVLVDFVQTYRSDSYSGVKRKHQYWRREGRTWRIVLEEGI